MQLGSVVSKNNYSKEKLKHTTRKKCFHTKQLPKRKVYYLNNEQVRKEELTNVKLKNTLFVV